MVLAMAASTVFCQEPIIVESFEDGANYSGFEKGEGNWMPSVSKSKAEGVKATKSLFHTADGKAGTAKFVPKIPSAGKYDVYATYPQSGNAQGVIYKIHSAEGDKEVVYDQNGWDPAAQPPANVWFPLGTFQFAQGSEGYVELRDPTTGKPANEKAQNPRVYADAVMLLPAGTPPPGGSMAAAPAAVPAIPAAPATAAVPAMPALPAASTPAAASTMPAGLPTLGAGVPPPSIPGLAAALPAQPSAPAAPSNVLPSLPIDSPPSALSGGTAALPPMQPPSLQPAPSLPPPSSIAPPPAATAAAPPAPFQPDSSLQWLFDMGAAQSAAKAEKKPIMVFFVAPGNRIANRYESQYFTSAAVRPLLDKYVLVKIDFPKNTKQGYALGVFGAGNIVVTDHFGTKRGAITQVPATPEELAKALEAIKVN